MGKVIVLGAAAAVPDADSDNTHLIIQQGSRVVLIDAGSNPIVRVKKAGLDLNQITDLILTHFHPDHVSGVPLLMMGMWLMGRTQDLHVYGLRDTINRTTKMLELFDILDWPNFFQVIYHATPEKEMQVLIDVPDLIVSASPVCHLIPTMGLRMQIGTQKKIIAYSCDTEPCQAVIELSRDADVLFHEASGEGPGHTSPAQAGETANTAHVKSLYLIHYPQDQNKKKMIADARSKFPGEVELALDFQTIICD